MCIIFSIQEKVLQPLSQQIRKLLFQLHQSSLAFRYYSIWRKHINDWKMWIETICFISKQQLSHNRIKLNDIKYKSTVCAYTRITSNKKPQIDLLCQIKLNPMFQHSLCKRIFISNLTACQYWRADWLPCIL